MSILVNQLTKVELLWLSEHYCKAHRHDFLSHYNCFLKEKPLDSPFYERIGFLDIEATGLKANWDFMLCYCIKEFGGKIYGRHLEPKEILTYKFDRDLIKELLSDLQGFHRIVVYYGKDYRYDIPFVRTRALKWDVDFPVYKSHWVTDVYDIAKQKLCLHRTRLETVCNLLGIPSKGHRLEPDIWQKAQAGHKPSLSFIFSHCKEDVTSLEGAWKRLEQYTFRGKRSI